MLSKKVFCNLSALILLLLMPQFLFAQSGLKPRISVFPLENQEKDLQIEVISRNIQKTIEFNLKMINKYNIIQNAITEYPNSNSWLLAYCEKNNIDDLIFGKAVMQSSGSIIIEMSVFNRHKAAITLTKSETAETVFEIFEAADKLAVEMMGSFSGMHIGFGDLKFINNGDKGKYSVYIDNVFAGEDIEDFPKVLYGERHIKITQVRMFEETAIYDNNIIVTENKTTEVLFSIPGFLEKESKAISQEEIYIDKNWDNKYSGSSIDKSFDKLLKLLGTVTYSQTAIDKKKEVEDKLAQWNAKKKEEGLTRGLSILDKRLGVTAFGGINLMYPRYEETNLSGWESVLTANPKFGASISVNMLSYLAFQVELTYTMATADYENPNYLSKGADFELLEIPALLIFRFPPYKVFNIYGGGVFQLHVGDSQYGFIKDSDDHEYEDSSVPLKTYGTALAVGALFEMPMKLIFMSFDFRYVRSITNWADDSTATLYPDYFHATVGFGIKFF